MRRITEIIIHCSATEAGRDFTAVDIDRWHKQRGFKRIGYHYVVRLDGTVEEGRPVSEIGAHCKGHNAHSVGICYVGGLRSSSGSNGSKLLPADTRTAAQKQSLSSLVSRLSSEYPTATIHGHNEYAPKACPCFDASAEYSKL